MIEGVGRSWLALNDVLPAHVIPRSVRGDMLIPTTLVATEKLPTTGAFGEALLARHEIPTPTRETFTDLGILRAPGGA